MYNSGQDCLCSERFYIHQDVVHQLITCLSEEVSKIKVGNFLNKDAVVCPLVDRIAQNLFVLCKSNEHRKWHIPFYHDKNLVFPSLVETSLNDKLLLSEKFGPVFTYAVFNDYDVLDKALDSDYLFGITVCGSYNSPIVKKYPHITNQTTVISYESDDAHIPFGGRLKSGFVREGKSIRDGPILYSVETTKKYKN